MENDAETLRDTNVIQEPFQIEGVSSVEIPIQSITIDLGDLPRYDVAVGPSNADDAVIEEEEEDDWETESDDSDDNESYYIQMMNNEFICKFIMLVYSFCVIQIFEYM
ncbi:hypothetical protein Prudu_169S000300 [Prunus dulcis]|uniref:Uncharacterized protein n=1 Tax=Prunus dulcis TaxID=3755 RepID=A0A5H2Y3B1_PRUDU|nr:hypothetical protein Prudu_169S000300 [Prunus dulcis]